jgi:hypothetical protein
MTIPTTASNPAFHVPASSLVLCDAVFAANLDGVVARMPPTSTAMLTSLFAATHPSEVLRDPRMAALGGTDLAHDVSYWNWGDELVPAWWALRPSRSERRAA